MEVGVRCDSDHAEPVDRRRDRAGAVRSVPVVVLGGALGRHEALPLVQVGDEIRVVRVDARVEDEHLDGEPLRCSPSGRRLDLVHADRDRLGKDLGRALQPKARLEGMHLTVLLDGGHVLVVLERFDLAVGEIRDQDRRVVAVDVVSDRLRIQPGDDRARAAREVLGTEEVDLGLRGLLDDLPLVHVGRSLVLLLERDNHGTSLGHLTHPLSGGVVLGCPSSLSIVTAASEAHLSPVECPLFPRHRNASHPSRGRLQNVNVARRSTSGQK
jgi:hypothetical protein